MQKILIPLIWLLFTKAACAQSFIENQQWNNVFQDEAVTGVFVLCKNDVHSCITNNKVRATTAYLPASTFKIANALIGLETGVIKDEFEIFRWDGKPRAMKQWEADLTLRSAIQVSAVPVFQQIARAIGKKRMQFYVDAFSYGNADIGGGIDRFWLDGKLRISAYNQVTFIEALYRNQLPVSTMNQYLVKKALITEATQEYLVCSKTGYSGVGTDVTPGIAWWVGWVERGTDVYYFAFNMDINDEKKLPARKSIPRKIMALEGLVLNR